MDQLPPPPPYTPHDPNAPSSETFEQPPIRASMRGGYLNIIDEPEDVYISSAAGYFEQRPLTVHVYLPLMGISHNISPLTTRDDLSFAPKAVELQSHDVSVQDWATFVNYIVAELRNDVQQSHKDEPISPEEFRECLPRIDAVVAEWNREFFEPRKVLFTPKYTYEAAARSPSPSPSYRTTQTLPPPFPAPPLLPTFPPMMPTHTGHPMGPHMGPPPPMGPPHLAGCHYPSPMQIIPPQISRPSLPLFGSRVHGRHHSHEHHGHGRRGRGSHRGRGHHRRSSSISSSSSSSASSSSGSSINSIMSEDIEGADEKDLKQMLENFRLNPTRLDNVKSAIRQLHSELHSHRSGNHRGLSRCHRNSIEQTCEMKASMKANKKLVRSEIKAFVKEARTHKKALKRQRKAEKRIAKAEKHFRKVERRVRGSGRDPYSESILGSSNMLAPGMPNSPNLTAFH